MGLDWLPLNKPRPGEEAEFERLFRKLASKSRWFRESRLARFQALGVSPFETLGAPRIGHSAEADGWALALYESRQQELTREEWLAKLRGLYVVPLVPPCDGIPYYSNGTPGGDVEPFSFRGQWLTSCGEILGDALLESAFHSKFAREALAYGDALAERAQSASREAQVGIPAMPPEDLDSVAGRLHVVDAAARWCRFWGERGHGFETYW